MSRTTLNEALYWYDQGVTPIPCGSRSKIAVIKWTHFLKELPPRGLVEAWFRNSSYNIALLTGGPRNFTVLDFDSEDAFDAWSVRNPQLADCTRVVKSSRGFHLYFFLTMPLGRTFGLNGDIDVKGSGYVLSFPSVHPSGAAYKVILDLPPLELAFPLFLSSLGMTRLPEQPQATVPNSPMGTDPVIKEIKERIQVLDYVRLNTDTVRASGTDGTFYSARCFLHDDHTPSMWINAKKNRWGCFSSNCPGYTSNGHSWDIINLYALHHSTACLGDAIKALWNLLYGAAVRESPQ